MHWGKWIVLSFILFAVFIGTLVTVCMNEDISLVSRNYYEEELEFEVRLEGQRNVETLPSKPTVSLISPAELRIACDQFNELDSGEVVLFSPIGESRDRKFVLKRTSGNVATFDLSAMQKGRYLVRIAWNAGGKPFYLEESISL